MLTSIPLHVEDVCAQKLRSLGTKKWGLEPSSLIDVYDWTT